MAIGWSARLAYDRERGRFRVFRAKAVVLATGGIGRAYKITSNSWEYTGDGHSLAYHAGAELIDMEFVQFHPTGMVWPPSVMRDSRHRRRARRRRHPAQQGRQAVHVRRHPGQLQGPDCRQPGGGLALLHRATRMRGGRRNCSRATTSPAASSAKSRKAAAVRTAGSISTSPGSRKRSPTPPSTSSASCPSMYHQFKQLADIDITREPMEVGPTTHYIMGGIRVDADTQMSSVPGLFAAGECAAGINGANRLGGNSLSDLLVFGKRAGEFAARFAQGTAGGTDRCGAGGGASRTKALAPFERGADGGEPVPGPTRPAGDDAGSGRHRPPRR